MNVQTRSDEAAATVDARVQLLIAEYTWVAGLIRYYREVELKALAGETHPPQDLPIETRTALVRKLTSG